ncbi:MAG: radical SAM protein [candidate division Zixibacteria bacterium]|nr:radical SAM protein [candidate division Zixibacteria bacterium]
MFINAATFALTNNCNLACSYCFVGEKQKTSMPLKTAQKAVDWLLRDDISGPVGRVDITFFGGEPFMEFKKIQKIVPYAKSKAKETGKEMHFNVTTNGTLFNEKIAQFWKEYKLGLLLSCDGIPDAHNFHRKTKNGNGSYSLIEKNLDNILEASSSKEVRMTVAPETVQYLKQGVQFLVDLGFLAIAVFHAEEYDWTKEQLLEFENQFYEIGEIYTTAIEQESKIQIGPLDRYIKAKVNGIDKNFKEESSCGAGRGYIGISSSGGIYPCHRFFTANSFQGAFPIGHIDTGLDEQKRMPFLRMKRRFMLGCDSDCKYCPVIDVCSGGCMAANYDVTGHLTMRPPTARYFEIIWDSVAQSMVDYFDKTDPEKLKKQFANPASKPC